MFDTLSAAVTAAVSAALMVSMGGQFVARRRPYAFWWGLSFLAAFLGAGLQVWAFSQGHWPVFAYRGYVLVSAAIPGVMGAGSLYLLWPRLARAYAVVIGLAVLLTAVGAFGGVLHPVDLANVLKAGEQVTAILPSPEVTIGFGVLGTLGAAALILGALWSWWRTRLAYNLGIAAGGLIFTVGNALSALGIPALFFLAEVVGILVLFGAVRAARVRHAPTTEEAPADRPAGA